MSRKQNSKRPDPQQLLVSMVRAARAGGKVLLDFRGRNIHAREKLGAGLVSDADIQSERAILAILRRARPDFGVMAEEGAPTPGAGTERQGRWIIDPLDGTTNYVHGFPVYCVSIAAEWEGEVIAGVIFQPVLKDLYTAIRGRGAFLNGKRMRVSATPKLADAALATGFAYLKKKTLAREMGVFQKMSQLANAIRRPGSAALDLAYTARGVFDGFWERGLSPWDVAAGGLLVTEAGGKLTDFDGSPFRLDAARVVASNARIHSSITRITRTVSDPAN